MINKVTLVGHLGRDPETRTLENGTKVSTFTLATSESYRDKNDQWQQLTEWHNIVAWRYLAEKAERELKKGSLVYVEGKITHRKYTDKEGAERSVTEIIASQLVTMEKRENQIRNSESNNPGLANQDFGPLDSGVKSTVSTTPESHSGDDDLPF